MLSSKSLQSETKFDTTFLNNPNRDYENKNVASFFLFSLLHRQTLLLVIFFATIGFLLPNLYAHINGFPVPHVHDEFSYLLAADTFANGRITNPTPEFYEHFESPHLLVMPTYMSKFPPAQGLILALGQIIFGQPIYGVWISCGLFSAALFWMSSVWFGSRWAILGTAIMLIFVGTESYWAQSFWGGSMAAFGGCVFFGSFRQLLNKLSPARFLLLIFGGTVMINSRPFEGLLTMLPSLIFLLVRLINDNSFSVSQKFRGFILPSFIATLVFISAMSFYNFRVTGSAFKFPYTIHQTQYFSTPLFTFQTPLRSELRGTPRLRSLYDQLTYSEPLKYLSQYGIPETNFNSSVFAVFYLLINIPCFLISAPFTIFLFIFSIPVLRKDNLTRLVALTLFFTAAGMATATYWERPHYSAPSAACVFLLLIAALKLGNEYLKVLLREKSALISIIIFSICIYEGYNLSAPYCPNPPIKALDEIYKDEIRKLDNLKTGERATIISSIKATYLKPEIENYFENLPGKYLALVSYDAKQSVHQEVVYNKADIENSKFIWAYDLGEEKNANLIKHFGDRKIIYVNISPSQMSFGKFPFENLKQNKFAD